MQQVNIHEAKTHLSRLLEDVQRGEEIILAKAGKPIAKLSPYTEDARPQRVPGAMKGKIWIAPDMDAVDAEIARLFEESEIFPPEKK